MTRSRPTKRPNCRHSQSQDSHTSQPTAVVVLPDVWGGIGAAPGNQGDTLQLNPSTPELKQVPAWSETATVCEEKYSAQLSWSTCHLAKLSVKTILKKSNLWWTPSPLQASGFTTTRDLQEEKRKILLFLEPQKLSAFFPTESWDLKLCAEQLPWCGLLGNF